MAEALAVADVALVSTFATEDADNIRQQTTINGNDRDRGDVVAVVTKATTAAGMARCHGGGGGGRRSGRGDSGNNSGGSDRGSGGNKGSGKTKGSGVREGARGGNSNISGMAINSSLRREYVCFFTNSFPT